MRNSKCKNLSKNKKQSNLKVQNKINRKFNSLTPLDLTDIYKTLQDKENIRYNNNITLSFYKINKPIQAQNKKLSKSKLNNSNKITKIKQTKSFNKYQIKKIMNTQSNKGIKTNIYNKPIKKASLNGMEINKILSNNNKSNNFSQTTFNIYNVNTPIYNLINFPTINPNKKYFSPRANNNPSFFLNKTGTLDKTKKINSKSLLNYSDNENEKNQTITTTGRPFSPNNYNNINKIKRRKHMYNILNIYKNKFNFFKSPFDTSKISIKQKKDNNNTKNNKMNKTFKPKIKITNKNNNKIKHKLTGLKKYLTLLSPKGNINKSNLSIHSKENSKSFLSQLNNSHINKKPKIITKKVMKINSCTLAGYTPLGVQKLNQDKFFIKKDFLDEPEQFFIGVCDGHGMHGHFISEYISKFLPQKLTSITNDESIKSVFLSLQNTLNNNSITKIDSSLSGTTCTSIIISQDKIICMNLGDSRAILARYEKGAYNVINLSRDHKLNEHDEMKRIINKGGIIKQYYDNKLKESIGPQRVFLNNSEIPGLAMSRSFGDSIAHNIGVISEPEIFRFNYNGNEKFIVIATDGIWQFIDSEECVKIMKEYYENNMDAVGGLNALVKEAFKRWKNEEENVDDITAIVIFFE